MRAGEIQQIVRAGQRLRTAHCDVRVGASLVRLGRVGIVVPKFGRTAVARNRVKRRLGELVRRELLAHLGTCDVLIRARPEAYKATFEQLRDDVRNIRLRVAVRSSDH